MTLGKGLRLVEPPWSPDLAKEEKGCDKAGEQAQLKRRLFQHGAQATVFSRSILGWSASPGNWSSGVSDTWALSIVSFIRLCCL